MLKGPTVFYITNTLTIPLPFGFAGLWKEVTDKSIRLKFGYYWMLRTLQKNLLLVQTVHSNCPVACFGVITVFYIMWDTRYSQKRLWYRHERKNKQNKQQKKIHTFSGLSFGTFIIFHRSDLHEFIDVSSKYGYT